MLFEFSLSTPRESFYNITPQVREAVTKSGVTDGIAVVYCPHTTAGITINENADPDVVHDLLIGLDKSFPDRPEFQHGEGNSAARGQPGSVAAYPCPQPFRLYYAAFRAGGRNSRYPLASP